jgi:hypothetical protein
MAKIQHLEHCWCLICKIYAQKHRVIFKINLKSPNFIAWLAQKAVILQNQNAWPKLMINKDG